MIVLIKIHQIEYHNYKLVVLLSELGPVIKKKTVFFRVCKTVINIPNLKCFLSDQS